MTGVRKVSSTVFAKQLKRLNTREKYKTCSNHTHPSYFPMSEAKNELQYHSVSMTWTDSSTTSSVKGVTVLVSTAVVPGLYLYVPSLVPF